MILLYKGGGIIKSYVHFIFLVNLLLLLRRGWNISYPNEGPDRLKNNHPDDEIIPVKNSPDRKLQIMS